MASWRYVVCDVFTERPLEGNPLAVFTDATGLSDDRMQALAREMNFSETVFLERPRAGGHARLRIFTPAQEIPFAGHPVLGTAFVIGQAVYADELQLETGKGLVVVRLEREGSRPRFGWMEQPLPAIEPFAEAQQLLDALGVTRAESPIELYDNGIRHVYVELASREAVAQVRPNFEALGRLPLLGVSTFAGAGACYKTRVFAPAGGVTEDPATGSAAGPLALHLARHGRIAFGDEIQIEQGVELARPSLLFARVNGTRDAVEGVLVGGSAVIVARGEFKLPRPS